MTINSRLASPPHHCAKFSRRRSQSDDDNCPVMCSEIRKEE